MEPSRALREQSAASIRNLGGLAWHIRAITARAIAFLVVGALIRLAGLG
jgi:hypothetical protein